MPRRREGEQTPFWKRVELVMKVQMGQMTPAAAARELGVGRQYYYKLEEEMLRAAVEAVTPQKPGPKAPSVDPALEAVKDKLTRIERERELLEIKVKHLEEIQKEMISRGIGVLREKKQSIERVPQRHRKKVHGPVPPDGAVEGGGTPGPGRQRPRPMPGNGSQPGQSAPVEGEGGESRQARAEASGGRGRDGDESGSARLRSGEARDVGRRADVRGTRGHYLPGFDPEGAR